jgi:hypothetical protein
MVHARHTSPSPIPAHNSMIHPIAPPHPPAYPLTTFDPWSGNESQLIDIE